MLLLMPDEVFYRFRLLTVPDLLLQGRLPTVKEDFAFLLESSESSLSDITCNANF